MKKFISVLAAAALGMCAVPVTASADVVPYTFYLKDKDGNITEHEFKGCDVNEDGITDARDATIILAYYADLSVADYYVGSSPDEEWYYEITDDYPFLDNIKKYGDVTEDGWIDGRDSMIILSYYAYVSGETE